MELAQLFEALSHPCAFPYPVGEVEVRHTHISVVFLAGPYAYKIKKPVELAFLDFRTLENRQHFCVEEVRLNRRLAPSVYLGVVPICRSATGMKIEGQGEVIEWAVKMERLPEEATLRNRLLVGEVGPVVILSLAQRIASFHAHAEAGEHISKYGEFAVVARNARENFEQTAPQVGVTVSRPTFERLRTLTEKHLNRLRPLIEARAARGIPRDTHGDLHLDHVYLFPERAPPGDLVIIDCIEFNERFRHADPVADMAFLVMDLKYHGRSDLAELFADEYFRASGDEEGRALLSWYTAYRAVVRAKVEGFELTEKEIPEVERRAALIRAQRHWSLALDECERQSGEWRKGKENSCAHVSPTSSSSSPVPDSKDRFSIPHLTTDSSLALFTDLYELTMAQAYWQSARNAPATFSLFFRKYPPDRAYFVFVGLADVLDFLENFRFSPGDIAFLRSLERFDEEFLRYLGQLRFTGSVRAMSEGTIFFINEPVIEVTATVIEAQLIETFLVNQVNLQTILATKASRVVHAARGRRVIDFAARRTHGVEAANKLARACHLIGFNASSNTMAGALYGMPVSGTMAHSYVTAFETEIEAFRHFARSFPDNSIFLVDTYDTLTGTRKAAIVANEMRMQGHHLQAIRLDSGDLLDLSHKARAILDEAGLPDVQIFASGGLDEFEVDELVRAGAPIDGFGVGTKVGVSADAPWTDCAYKMVQYAGRPVLKLSPGKQTLPGPKQVVRYRDSQGYYLRDIIGCADEVPTEGEPLLSEVMNGGNRLHRPSPLEELRQRFRREFACLPERHKRLRSPELFDVQLSQELDRLQQTVVAETKQRQQISISPQQTRPCSSPSDSV
jgi:nicotinate phosphoribosyltransferase